MRRRMLAATLLLLPLVFGFGCRRSELLLVGTLERTRVELAAPIAERIAEIPSREGDLVKKGDVVLRFDTSVMGPQYADAASQAEQARADLRRSEQLYSEKVISQEEYDRASHTARQKLALADEWKARLEQLTVRAPSDARVDELPFEIGERPRAGDIIAVLLSQDVPYARIFLPEPSLAALQVGDAAQVRVDGIDRWLDGKVRKISHVANFTPYFALTDREKSRLVFETEVDVTDPEAQKLPTG
ncbi:MAG: HlyD family efflux transporter periplasmic adaptor subunit, partial [Verrucomicrobiae bacterium]|nr:HlyD family efflux transporter periplasmic adaptor subunit [Verrucomicrobiae bacterium]